MVLYDNRVFFSLHVYFLVVMHTPRAVDLHMLRVEKHSQAFVTSILDSI